MSTLWITALNDYLKAPKEKKAQERRIRKQAKLAMLIWDLSIAFFKYLFIFMILKAIHNSCKEPVKLHKWLHSFASRLSLHFLGQASETSTHDLTAFLLEKIKTQILLERSTFQEGLGNLANHER